MERRATASTPTNVSHGRAGSEPKTMSVLNPTAMAVPSGARNMTRPSSSSSGR